LEQWLITLEGIQWLRHNANLTSGGTVINQEIEEIIEREGF